MKKRWTHTTHFHIKVNLRISVTLTDLNYHDYVAYNKKASLAFHVLLLFSPIDVLMELPLNILCILMPSVRVDSDWVCCAHRNTLWIFFKLSSQILFRLETLISVSVTVMLPLCIFPRISVCCFHLQPLLSLFAFMWKFTISTSLSIPYTPVHTRLSSLASTQITVGAGNTGAPTAPQSKIRRRILSVGGATVTGTG